MGGGTVELGGSCRSAFTMRADGKEFLNRLGMQVEGSVSIV